MPRPILFQRSFRSILAVLFSGVLSLFSPLQSFAEDYTIAEGHLHSFNNNITVYTVVFALNKEISLETTTYFKYTVDMINPSFGEGEGDEGAEGLEKRTALKSLAAVSGASTAAGGGRSVTDTRNDLLGGVSHNFWNRLEVEVYYDYSQEKDYTSSTPILTFKKELFEKNTTLSLGYSRNSDRINGLFMPGAEHKDTDNYYIGMTQILSPVTIAQVGYSRSEVNGYIPEGNRLVPVDGATASSCTDLSALCLGEAFPGHRTREAALFGLNYYWVNGVLGILGLTDRSSLQTTFRYYRDDWDIVSHVEQIEYYQYLAERTLLRLSLRNYHQTGAFFIKDVYSSGDLYRSATPPMERQNSQLVGVKLIHTFSDDPGNGLFSNNSLEGGYEYYTQSLGVHAHNVTLGFRFRF